MPSIKRILSPTNVRRQYQRQLEIEQRNPIAQKLDCLLKFFAFHGFSTKFYQRFIKFCSHVRGYLNIHHVFQISEYLIGDNWLRCLFLKNTTSKWFGSLRTLNSAYAWLRLIYQINMILIEPTRAFKHTQILCVQLLTYQIF